MKFEENINEIEYENFVSSHKKSHFMQSYYWGEVMKKKNFTPHYVGLKKKNKLVATALLLEKKLPKGYCYFYCPRGYIIDFNDLETVKIFTEELTKYARKHKCIFIKIDPDIKRHDLDSEGNILGNDNNKLIEFLKNNGYKHKGFNIEFTNEQPRFTFRLDLTQSEEEILSNIHSTSRKILNKGNQYGFSLYKGDVNDISDFYITMEETAERENLGCNPIEYYKNFYEVLHKHNMSDLYVVKLNIKDLRKTYEDKIKDIDSRMDALNKNTKVNPKKQENRKKELETEKNRVNKDILELDKIDCDEVVLSSIMTAKYGDKVWTVHGGNITALRYLNANYYLYYNIIIDAKHEGYKQIDFFGCSGDANPDKSSSIYGLHNFKKRLGGEYHEFIGEFDLVTNKLMYFIFNTLIPIRRKLQKRKLRKR